MPIDPHSRLRPADHVYARELDGELVLLDLGGGEYYGLDAIGARVWRALEEGDGGVALAAVAAELVPDYDVAADVLLEDLLALAGELEARGLVVVADGG